MSKDLIRYGNSYICVDYELKAELQNKLIAGILKFHTV
ncbi:helix-turn-helix domain-containing protein [Pectinatus frisingensis]|nr:helix-turn-helix domain-containing protein [Pectinatus frisingensis]